MKCTAIVQSILPFLLLFQCYISLSLEHYIDSDSSDEDLIYPPDEDLFNSNFYDDQSYHYIGDPFFENEHKSNILEKLYEWEAYDNYDENDERGMDNFERNNIDTRTVHLHHSSKKCKEKREGPFPTLTDPMHIVSPMYYYNISCQETFEENHSFFEGHKRGALIFYCLPDEKNRCETAEKEVHVFKKSKFEKCWKRHTIYIKAGCKCS